MAWNLRADFIETCRWNMLSLRYGVRELMVMDQGWCASVWLLRVRQGNGSVTLGGRTLAMGFYFPGPTLYDGNGTARLYIDDGASAEQRREVEATSRARRPYGIGRAGDAVAPTQTAQIAIQEHTR